ncbi:AVN_HP_G0114650.mRNA.1.CDS.1 [Saccharomyces cerevisiae]|nr:AVN_HP_G0026980.mRNA.1.CDS.1 [Saccharomyces cerevisiae]CAI5011822.1 AVN_HP_G0053750.mRNA.1.CDS.1 [Saccharomyces cerevisiae]CAI5154427.1 AVN_HP_G0114650.mRNA.1.CDS.1 [Saccharomyces cerevisiae]CAI6805901.1 AVN_HP_G0026980.mRNA.1.CDS.1 [Saccharomyces cerevisiae]CAI6928400.1 AVN_HP_G0053750.mRNA.1.CDS.1 [Saccharomyces cerevisiae]
MTSLYAPGAEDIRQRLRPFGFFFEKSLKDLIKGIRSHNETPEKLDQFFKQVLSECREEVNSPDLNSKTNAVLKLTYLEMYGFDMAWCNFHILEVMSSNKLQQKRVGYLAASQSFYKDSDILMLATNLLKKDLKYDGNNDVVKVGIALSGLSTIITPSLARDIADDLFTMLNSTRPYIRKKAITALFKVFLQYPEALRDNFDKFVSKLDDDDISVVSAAVSVICELSKKNPQPFIQLSPLLYEILVTIDNNWIIIRLLKLFTNLSQVEPKLRAKLLPKILELMESTVATSVIYESVNCIVKGNMLEEDDFETAMACLERLHTFCDSQDPNLRYISCILFYKIGKINTDFISRFDQLIIRLLSDVDVSIRSKAIELVEGIVDEDNLKAIVQTLMKQFVDEDVVILQTGSIVYEKSKRIPIIIPENYKIKMVNVIISICSADNYSSVNDFEWYNAVIMDLAMLCQDISDKSLGSKIGEQFRNLMIKVPSMREVTIANIIKLISNDNINKQLPTVLRECIWCLGEFSTLVENGNDLIKIMTENISYYSHSVQEVLILALVKVFSNWCNNFQEDKRFEIKMVLKELIEFFENLSYSSTFEVQERSVEVLEFLRLSLEALEEDTEGLPMLLSEVLPSFFNAYELAPIARGTQLKLAVDENLDLETPFLTKEAADELLDEQKSDATSDLMSDISMDEQVELKFVDDSDTSYEEKEKLDDFENPFEIEREKERMSNPYYLGEEDEERTKNSKDLLDLNEEESSDKKPETIRLNRTDNSLNSLSLSTTEISRKKKKGKKKNRVQVLSDEPVIEAAPKRKDAFQKPHDNHSTQNPLKKDKINLRMHSQLENFDFSNFGQSSNAGRGSQEEGNLRKEDELELSRLEANLIVKDEKDNLSDTEEVIVIKKKKKGKKSKSKNKLKTKAKNSPEPNEFLRDQSTDI